jgi:hypothetical protein
MTVEQDETRARAVAELFAAGENCEFWLNHPEIVAVEILTTPKTAAIFGTLNGRTGKAGTAS